MKSETTKKEDKKVLKKVGKIARTAGIVGIAAATVAAAGCANANENKVDDTNTNQPNVTQTQEQQTQMVVSQESMQYIESRLGVQNVSSEEKTMMMEAIKNTLQSGNFTFELQSRESEGNLVEVCKFQNGQFYKMLSHEGSDSVSEEWFYKDTSGAVIALGYDHNAAGTRDAWKICYQNGSTVAENFMSVLFLNSMFRYDNGTIIQQDVTWNDFESVEQVDDGVFAFNFVNEDYYLFKILVKDGKISERVVVGPQVIASSMSVKYNDSTKIPASPGEVFDKMTVIYLKDDNNINSL